MGHHQKNFFFLKWAENDSGKISSTANVSMDHTVFRRSLLVCELWIYWLSLLQWAAETILVFVGFFSCRKKYIVSRTKEIARSMWHIFFFFGVQLLKPATNLQDADRNTSRFCCLPHDLMMTIQSLLSPFAPEVKNKPLISEARTNIS